MSIMRRLRLLAIGALLVMAVAASAASATTVRDDFGNPYTGAVNATLAAGTTADFTSGFVNISCDQSSIAGSLANSNGTGLSISSASWTDSSTGGAGCPNNIGGTSTVTAVALPWTGGSFVYVGNPPEDGDVTVVVRFRITNTGAGTTCEYQGTAKGKLDNAAGTLTITNATLTKVSGSFLCSSTMTYSATWDLRGSGLVHLKVTA